MILEKYGGLDLYDEYAKKIFIIYHANIQYEKDIWNLIGITEKTDGSSTKHEC